MKNTVKINAEKDYRILKTTKNQSSRLVDRLAGITAKTVIKNLIPDSEQRLKEKLKVFIRHIASTAIL